MHCLSAVIVEALTLCFRQPVMAGRITGGLQEDYLAATAAASSLAAVEGFAVGPGVGSTGLSTLDSVLIGAWPGGQVSMFFPVTSIERAVAGCI